ncbi:small acid-soluble spore protein P [Cohnella zeiphila]|uniref:Small acid-soluble spore protein P n=1 Tax=Cohnella zeiphila TaxID=2761120 RepID=A0A7X0SU93_9BACL|nr:small acid-soluble spore protein P [Cohnella zeiphila]MBB6733998.1 small acid-soluble spore protein P [Cohnella zeiphila]
MSKPRTQPVGSGQSGSEHARDQRASDDHQPNEPLSGSKKVKNRNHSRHNNGEG